MVMGRGSDTRMYSPRSESNTMYSSANEDGDKYSPTSPEDADKRRENKQIKDEERRTKLKDIKHIKIKPSQGLGQGPSLPTEEGLDDGNKRDDEREIGLQGGPAGSRGHLLDLATGAKTGTGSAMGTGNSAVRTGEPMDGAWSELLKEIPTGYSAVGPSSRCDNTQEGCDGTYEAHYRGPEDNPKELVDIFCPKCGRYHELTGDVYDRYLQTDMARGEHPSQQNIQTGEPMDNAWSELLKEKPPCDTHDVGDGTDEDTKRYFDEEVRPEVMNPNTPRPHALMNNKRLKEKINDMVMGGEPLDADLTDEYNYRIVENDLNAQGNPVSNTGFDTNFQDLHRSKPMDNAWSNLLKRETPKTIQARRRREARQQFRPSTGQFKKPPGGQSGGAGATMRRFKSRMRGIKGGRKTGLMKPHLSVEMSHRGIATKQPMSKDPQKYRQYMGQQEAQKILGGVRNTFSPHARHSARSFQAGPTGGGRLTGMLPGQAGQMRQPSITRLRRPRMPRIRPVMPPTPPMPPQVAPPMSSVPSMPAPSSTMMMSEERTQSDILKTNRYANRTEMLELMRRLIAASRKRNELMKYVQGGGSAFEDGHVPTHPAGVHQHEDEEEKNDGPTQNLETNSSRLGLDPAGHLSGKRGHFG